MSPCTRHGFTECFTEDWLELTVRFLGPDHGIRGIKDKMSRDILAGLEKQGIGIGATRQEAVTNESLREAGLTQPASRPIASP